jgi:phasin family protein
MFKIEDMQMFGKDQMDVAQKSFMAFQKGMQTLTTEAVDYTKKSFEASTSHFEKLAGVKTFDKAIELQTDFAKAAYEGFVAQATKMGELSTAVAKDAYKPYEGIVAKATAAAK